MSAHRAGASPRSGKGHTAGRPATLESIEHFKSIGEPVVLVVPPEGAVFARATSLGQGSGHDS